MRVKWGEQEIETDEQVEGWKLRLITGVNQDNSPRYVLEARPIMKGALEGSGHTVEAAARVLRDRIMRQIITLELLLESHS